MYLLFISTPGAPRPPPSPTRGRRKSAPRLLRQGYPGEEDPSPLVTSRLNSMGHTVLQSTVVKTGPKGHVARCPPSCLQASPPQPPGSPF
ncbi:hypothetical protein ElyMa_001304400 [Elysia marginata]|uniref:Uncharacterized protein n=1 Tax=Elysia marginata TaxID=1093978 RepID=A0AAV4ILC0_9GAST|nr:hypothetical protein ElyMa_001304400 [Elysia marginata]